MLLFHQLNDEYLYLNDSIVEYRTFIYSSSSSYFCRSFGQMRLHYKLLSPPHLWPSSGKPKVSVMFYISQPTISKSLWRQFLHRTTQRCRKLKKWRCQTKSLSFVEWKQTCDEQRRKKYIKMNMDKFDIKLSQCTNKHSNTYMYD